jgi:hypothetical protein
MDMFEYSVKKLLGIATLLCMALTISGCKIDGEEETEIHADGTVTMRVNYQFPELGLSLAEGKALVEYIQGIATRHESISVGELSCERAGNSTVRLIAEIHISDAIQLREIMKSELEMLDLLIEQRGQGSEELLNAQLLMKVKASIGEMSIGVVGLKIEYKRTINLGDSLKRQLPLIRPTMLGKYQFRYSLTTPSPSTKHNATTTSNNGKTLTWVMPLKDYFDEPFIMQATLPIPIPWWVWLLVGLAILLLLLILWKIFSYVKRKFKS